MSSEEEDSYSKRDMGASPGEDAKDEEAGEFGGEDDECPREPDDKEFLFLIEFLVDAMLIKPENMEISDMDPCLLQGQTCILLTFLHYPTMSICEKDIDPCRQTGENLIRFNAGKSLMFALSDTQFDNPPPIYLDVCACKDLPHGSVPNKLPIGMTKICLTELFKQVFEKVDEKPDKLPVSKSIKDKYQLIGKRKKCPTAEVTIYIRLSCLGQNVVTEFQRGGDECEPFLFKSKESKKVYECKPKELPAEDAEDLCPTIPGWGVSGGKDCGDAGGPAQNPGGYDNPCSSGNNPQDVLDDDEFEEFGTEVHGHSLTIKVQKSQKKQLGIGEGKASSGNQITFQVPQNQTLCNKGRGPNKAAVYNINTLDGGACGNREPLQIVQGVDSPDKDIFVLRIGKKGETYGKGKLELELRTPKPKIERPIQGPRKWDKAIQTEKEEQPKKGKKRK